jgi:cytochrome c oxidase assembly factor CtaG
MVGFNAVLVATQLPVILGATSASFLLDVLIQLVFLGVCVLLWLPVMASAGLSKIGKIGYLLVAGVPPTIPGVVLAFSRHPLYPGFGLGDQQLAGLLLFATAKFTLIAGTFLVLWRLLSAEAEPGDDEDRPASIPYPPPSAPAWLRQLDQELPPEPAPVRRATLLSRRG